MLLEEARDTRHSVARGGIHVKVLHIFLYITEDTKMRSIRVDDVLVT